MGLLDRLLGRTHDERSYHGVPGRPDYGASRAGESPGKHGYAPHPDQQPAGRPGDRVPAAHRDPDEVAVERYRYLLRTAPPDAVEQAHAEAFARLTPEQRQRVLQDLGSGLPPAERAASDDPQSLARMATRAELRNPGTLEQSFRGQGGYGARGPSFGSMMGSSLLGTVAGVVIGSAVANAMFGPAFGDPSQDFAGDAGGGDGGGDAGADAGGDAGYTDAAGADPGYGGDTGGDMGGFGDFGGGDFGGGDFGGGDFGGF
ncbi:MULTISPECIES: hypothetical protein [unclassified Isoptericola]|uniref:hypothetical protein n=1 Tax=unclassified Isoptericola TaxID=2623355 RepID=UPI0036527D68